MKQVPDRKKLRREYLRKKGMAYSAVSTLRGLSLVFGLVAVGCGMLTMFFLLNIFGLLPQQGITSALLSLVAGIASLSTRRRIDRDRRKAEQELAQIPPIPPVPADEILVRGSEEPPVAQSEVLLRAAKGQETPKEELLRVSQE